MTDIAALDVVQKAGVVADLEGFVKLWDSDGVWTHSGHSQISGPHSVKGPFTATSTLTSSDALGKARPRGALLPLFTHQTSP